MFIVVYSLHYQYNLLLLFYAVHNYFVWYLLIYIYIYIGKFKISIHITLVGQVQK